MNDEPSRVDRRTFIQQLRDEERKRLAREKAAEWAADHPAELKGTEA